MKTNHELIFIGFLTPITRESSLAVRLIYGGPAAEPSAAGARWDAGARPARGGGSRCRGTRLRGTASSGITEYQGASRARNTASRFSISGACRPPDAGGSAVGEMKR